MRLRLPLQPPATSKPAVVDNCNLRQPLLKSATPPPIATLTRLPVHGSLETSFPSHCLERGRQGSGLAAPEVTQRHPCSQVVFTHCSEPFALLVKSGPHSLAVHAVWRVGPVNRSHRPSASIEWGHAPPSRLICADSLLTALSVFVHWCEEKKSASPCILLLKQLLKQLMPRHFITRFAGCETRAQPTKEEAAFGSLTGGRV